MTVAPKLLPLRIRLPYTTEEEFIDKYGSNVGRGGVFIATRALKEEGTAIAFEFILADGSRLLRGEGVVVKAQADEGSGRSGMTVRFAKLDAPSKALIDRMVARRGGEPGSEPVASPARVTPPPQVAAPPPPPASGSCSERTVGTADGTSSGDGAQIDPGPQRTRASASHTARSRQHRRGSPSSRLRAASRTDSGAQGSDDADVHDPFDTSGPDAEPASGTDSGTGTARRASTRAPASRDVSGGCPLHPPDPGSCRGATGSASRSAGPPGHPCSHQSPGRAGSSSASGSRALRARSVPS